MTYAAPRNDDRKRAQRNPATCVLADAGFADEPRDERLTQRRHSRFDEGAQRRRAEGVSCSGARPTNPTLLALGTDSDPARVAFIWNL
jgi:hypothetical protein